MSLVFKPKSLIAVVALGTGSLAIADTQNDPYQWLEEVDSEESLS